MTNPRLTLLSTVLDRQDPQPPDALDEPDYWLERLDGPGGWRLDEVTALWSRPGVRDAFEEARETRLIQARRRWREAAFDAPVQMMAAAAASPVRTFEGPGYEGVIIAPGRTGRSWVISLTLSASMAEACPGWARIRLFDDGGRTWLLGRPEPGSQVLEGRWEYEDETPADRLSRHAIQVELA